MANSQDSKNTNFGIFDIGGQGKQGYRHLVNGTYDDVPERHDRDAIRRDERRLAGDFAEGDNFFEKLAQQFNEFFGPQSKS